MKPSAAATAAGDSGLAGPGGAVDRDDHGGKARASGIGGPAQPRGRRGAVRVAVGMVALVEAAAGPRGSRLPVRSRLKHSASISRPSSSGRPQPRSAASRSVLIAGCGSAAISLGKLDCALETGAAGDDLVDEADLVGLGGIDHAAGDDQLHRPPPADDPRQPLGAAVGEADVPAAAGDPEGRVLVGDREVAPADPLEAAGVGDAVDGGDRRLVEVGPARGAEDPVRARPGCGPRSPRSLVGTTGSPSRWLLRSPPAQKARPRRRRSGPRPRRRRRRGSGSRRRPARGGSGRRSRSSAPGGRS